MSTGLCRKVGFAVLAAMVMLLVCGKAWAQDVTASGQVWLRWSSSKVFL
jgi:hypothetical protein